MYLSAAAVIAGSLGLLAIVVTVFSLLDSKKKPSQPKKSSASAPAVQTPPPMRDFTVAELLEFNGEGGRPLYTGINGFVFDLRSHPSGEAFYGPGGPYHIFSGRDATIFFAKMALDPADVAGVTMDSLSYAEIDTLRDWELRLEMKYRKIGYLTDGIVKRSVAAEAATADADASAVASDKTD